MVKTDNTLHLNSFWRKNYFSYWLRAELVLSVFWTLSWLWFDSWEKCMSVVKQGNVFEQNKSLQPLLEIPMKEQKLLGPVCFSQVWLWRSTLASVHLFQQNLIFCMSLITPEVWMRKRVVIVLCNHLVTQLDLIWLRHVSRPQIQYFFWAWLPKWRKETH